MHAENVRVVHSTRMPCTEAWRLGCTQTLLPLTSQLLLGGCEAEGTWYTFKCLLACLPHKKKWTGGSPCLGPCHSVDVCQSFSLSEPWTLPVPPLKPPWSPPQPHSNSQPIQSLQRSCFLSKSSRSSTGEFWKGGGAWG